ncbi:lipid-A-disaccharide synthase [Lishizhenia tianjinensis]|uniref:Lipid-A-disaccharide synthase n=1 Tax=Lishizhenia tianjinensis TaxID=477690 RepID=A0A1I6XX88_9FLAO|nr:lipid-A-disaccharide synthase [Lishizhenia tianjinensis]SFT42846.1 lipid-A-disaccharide synthase [Lishizhenia tianjinensis]
MGQKRIYIIAGEASGDLHGSNLIKSLQQKDSTLDFRFWGGDKMEAQTQQKSVKHIRDLAFMGFAEVVMNLRTILGNINFCKQDILKYKPDAIVMIDYPGFNLRIAEWAKTQGIQVIYYVSPQIWAWKQNRVHKIKKVVDKMFVILPFEKEFYQRFDYEVEYVGHPLLDAIQQYKANNHPQFENEEKEIIALLPGSRKQEISRKLPVMLEAIKDFGQYRVVIAGAPSLDEDFYTSFPLPEGTEIVFGKTYDVLNVATAALVTSGTATLETALFKVPQVVCYKASPISYHIAKRLVKIKYISLVNLILDKLSVVELIQGDCNPKRIAKELKAVLPNGNRRHQVLEDYQNLSQILGGGGASDRIAEGIIKTIN